MSLLRWSLYNGSEWRPASSFKKIKNKNAIHYHYMNKCEWDIYQDVKRVTKRVYEKHGLPLIHV